MKSLNGGLNPIPAATRTPIESMTAVSKAAHVSLMHTRSVLLSLYMLSPEERAEVLAHAEREAIRLLAAERRGRRVR